MLSYMDPVAGGLSLKVPSGHMRIFRYPEIKVQEYSILYFRGSLQKSKEGSQIIKKMASAD